MVEVLVTGSKGLIGSSLVNRLKQEHNVDEFDIGDSLKNKRYDLIIHCAAHCVIREILKNPRLMIENIKVTTDVYEFARKTNSKKVIYFSSSRVNHSEGSPYTAGKLLGEHLAAAYDNCYGIKSLIIRPETVWDIGDWRVRVIPHWILCALKNQPIVVYGDRDKVLSPILLEEFIDITMSLINVNGNISISGQTTKVTDIINTILKITKSKSEVRFEAPEMTQPQITFQPDIMSSLTFEEQLRKGMKW